MICLCRFAGPLKCAVRTAEELARKTDLHLVLSADADPALLPSREIRVTYVPTGASAIGNVARTLSPFSYLRIRAAVRRFRPDVVHFAVEHAWNVLLHPILHGYPLVQTIHDPVRHLGEASRIYDRVRRVELRHADRFIVLSHASAASMTRETGLGERIDVVEHGAFEFDSQSWPHGQFPPPPLNSNLLFAGRFSPYKGIDVLLRAFELVARANARATLTLAGTGDISPYARLLERLPRVTLINRYLSEAEMARLHADCDFVVAPYLDATQSGVASMAISNGRPVIATRVGALPEQVEEGVGGILVDPDNVEQLTTAMLSLLNEPQRILDLSASGKRRFRERYGWPTLADKTLEVYQRAVGEALR